MVVHHAAFFHKEGQRLRSQAYNIIPKRSIHSLCYLHLQHQLKSIRKNSLKREEVQSLYNCLERARKSKMPEETPNRKETTSNPKIKDEKEDKKHQFKRANQSLRILDNKNTLINHDLKPQQRGKENRHVT